MVGRGDHHRVDVLAVEDGAEILDARHIPVEFRHPGNAFAQTGKPRIDPVVGRVEIGLIHVAQRNDLRIGVARKALKSWQPRLPTPMKPSRTWSLAPSTRLGAKLMAVVAATAAVLENARRFKGCDMDEPPIPDIGTERLCRSSTSDRHPASSHSSDYARTLKSTRRWAADGYSDPEGEAALM